MCSRYRSIREVRRCACAAEIGRSVASVPREKILLDVAIADEPTHTVRQRQTGQRRGQDSTVSLGIRTVNPGFYSPGIEVYSVLSVSHRCAFVQARTCA